MILAGERMLTYDELATAFGLTRRSVRQLVSQKGWSRSKGIDGRARIHVPVDSHPESSRSDCPSLDATAEVSLLAQVQRLERELATAIRERDEARSRATDLGIRAAQAKAMCEVLEAKLGIVETRQARPFWSRMFRLAPAV